VQLVFEATDKNIGNYSYTGSTLKQVDKLASSGQVDTFIDDDKLIVKDSKNPLQNVIEIVNMDTGMIGIPEITQQGIKVKYLYNNRSRVGGRIRVKSTLNPAANGDYIIYKLSFDLSNRDQPFYLTAEAKRMTQ